MKAKYLSLILVIFFFLLTACKPSEQAIQEAIAQTQTAQTTSTYTPEPTPTLTPEHSSTPTFTPTASPTPDTRVITTDSKDLMLEKEDLPAEAKYYLPNYTWISPHHNSEVVSAWGVEEGTIYLEETSRLDGWWVYFLRGTNTVRAPEQIYQNIIQYKTLEGACLTFAKYSFDTNNPEFTKVESDIIIGDATNIYINKEMQSNGEYYVSYIVESIYRNYISIVGGMDYEKRYDTDFVIQVAEIAMDKIKAAPLGTW